MVNRKERKKDTQKTLSETQKNAFESSLTWHDQRQQYLLKGIIAASVTDTLRPLCIRSVQIDLVWMDPHFMHEEKT